ncbi:hypothetical protein [Methanobrevibacter sp.]|uniref:hypothetical protein n=1 Tax=Methanobrevibacter sp. TaxID=66852 RepID=UPI00388FEF89
MKPKLYKVYAKLDENKVIKAIQSSIFLQDTTDWVEIDKGVGDKYAHAQGNYLSKSLIDANGKYNFKYVKGVVELTQEEKEALFPTPKPEPTELEKMDARLTYLEIMSEVI